MNLVDVVVLILIYYALPFAGIVFSSFTAAAVPPVIVNRLAAEFGRIAKMPDVIARFAGDETELVGSTPQELDAYITTQMARFAKIVRATGLRAD